MKWTLKLKLKILVEIISDFLWNDRSNAKIATALKELARAGCVTSTSTVVRGLKLKSRTLYYYHLTYYSFNLYQCQNSPNNIVFPSGSIHKLCQQDFANF